MSTRIGILTGGGDCPGLNGVIRAVTLHARQTYGWEVVGIHNGFEGLYHEEYLELTPHSVQHCLPRGGTMLGSSNRANPFAYPVKLPDGRVEIHDVSARCMSNLARLDLHGLIVVGGDGSMSFAHKFVQRGATRIVGVPKTIDNDLEATDYTVGFQTAVEVVVEAIDRLHTTAESHERIMIVEVMGRYAGWIALTSGLAGGAHVVLIPEIDYDPDRVIEAFHRRHGRGVSYSIAVVAEGAKPKDGDISTIGTELGREVRLGGLAEKIGAYLGTRTGFEVRSLVLGHLQRGGSPTHRDRLLALRFGAAAVRMVEQGKFGHIVAYHPPHMVPVPMEEAIATLKTVPLDSDTVQTARDLGICLGD